MNSDIRVLTSFLSSRKRRRFEAILGPNSAMHLIDLWLTVAIERPDGILTGWDETDIALAANWPGDPAEFMRVAMLEHCKWIEKHGDTYKIHDWEEHQGWACSAKERSEKAKNAAKARWSKRLNGKTPDEKTEQNQGVNATSNAQAMLRHQSSNAPSPSPSPSPSPNPTNVNSNKARDAPKKQKKPFIPPTELEVVSYFQENGYSVDVAKKAFAYYQAGGWKDSAGKQVRSWKQKMIAVWFKDENRATKSQDSYPQPSIEELTS